MNKAVKTIIVVLLAIAVGFIFRSKNSNANQPEQDKLAGIETTVNEPLETVTTQPAETKVAGFPKLVDLGADKCIPCKAMTPILEELKTQYAGSLEVEFIDLWKKPQEAEKYKIKLIPTQILYDASGKEIFRHEGFYSKEEILSKFESFGVILKSVEE